MARAGWLGIAALLAAALLWSLNGPLIKLLDREQVHPATIACYRSLLGAFVFVPWAWRGRRSLRQVHWGWPVAGVLTFTLMTASFVYANTLTFAANAILLQYTSPIWVFLLSPLLLKERPGWTDGLALLVALAGTGIIFAGNPRGHLAGLAAGLVAGLGYGALTVVLRGLRNVHPAMVVAVNALGSGLLLLPAAALWGQLLLTPYQITLMLLLALVQFTLPYLLFSWALQRVEAHRAALLLLIEAVLNPLWTFLVVGEVPPPGTLVGGPLILASVAGWLWLTWHRDRRARLLRTPA